MKKMILKIKGKFAPVLVLGFLLLAQSGIAGTINLESEIAQARLDVASLQHKHDAQRHNDAAQLELQTEKKYLEALEILSQENHLPSITSEFKQQLRGAIGDLDGFLNANIPVSATLQLFKHVEDHRNEWTMDEAPAVFTLHDTQNLEFPVKFELDEKSRIYLEYGKSLIGKGSAKKVFRVTRFEDWTPIARLQVRHPNNPVERASFEREKEFLTRIMALPQEQQVGLAKTFHVGRKIYQAKYDHEFFAILDGGAQVFLSPKARLEVIRKLSSSVMNMHQLGICVADIKPENILVKLSDNPENPIEDIVLADFGLSFEPAKDLKAGKKRPSVGSPHYAAPEVTETALGEDGWLGKDSGQKVITAFKSDVFSLGVVFYIMMHIDDKKGHIPWMGGDPTSTEYEETGRWGQFFDRRDFLLHKLLDRINQTGSSNRFEALDHLLGEALQPDPIGRISSELFHEKLLSILLGTHSVKKETARNEGSSMAHFLGTSQSTPLSVLKIPPPKETGLLARLKRLLSIQ